MLQKFAKNFSTLFVPPSLFFVANLYLAENMGASNNISIILISFLLGLMLPITVFFILKKSGKVSDNDASKKEERTLPFISGVLFLMVGIIIFYFLNIEFLIISFWIGYVILSLILLVINYFWKISAHMIGISSLIGLFFYLSSEIFYITIIIALVLAWARFYLRHHSLGQILAGSVLGFTVIYFSLFILNG